MDISSYESFEFKKIEQAIINIFKEFDAPFSLNQEKTHYGSSAGRNWLFGLMLNKDNKITIGHQKKKQFKVMLHSLLTDKSNWQVDDAQAFQGIMAYYESVEKDYVKDIVSTYEEKFGNGRTVKMNQSETKCFMLSMGNNPMVGASVACAVAVQEGLTK